MTGTGTQADPYIISTVDDLYSLSTVGGAVYCELGADIDLNGTPYAEHFSTIPLNCLSLDGKGHSIRNIYVSAPTDTVKIFEVQRDISISNLIVENFETIGLNIHIFASNNTTSKTVSLYNCILILKITRLGTSPAGNNRNLMQYITTVNTELCTISVQGSMKLQYQIIKNSSYIRRTHIHLDITTQTANQQGGADTSIVGYTNVTDSYITGRISSPSVLSGYLEMSYNTNFYNCYYALEFVNQGNIRWANSTFGSPCFYDRELSGDKNFVTTNFYGLTTAQCKDVEYLQSIGFIVEGAE